MSFPALVDRQHNPVHNQGIVTADTNFDVGARTAILAQNARGASIYSGAQNPDNWNLAPRTVLFTAPGLSGAAKGSRPHVLGSTNGLGAPATQKLASASSEDLDTKDKEELVRLSIQNEIVPFGVSMFAHDVGKSSQSQKIAAQLRGLATLPMGRCTDENGNMDIIRPGDRVAVRVPRVNEIGGSGAAGNDIQTGFSPSKYTLQVCRASTRSAAATAKLHVRAILSDPAKWKLAMGEYALGTHAWLTAAIAIQDSYLSGVVLALQYLLQAGDIAVPAGSRLGVVPAGGDSLSFAANLSRALKLTGSGPAPVEGLRLRNELLQRIFHEKSKKYEAGYDPNVPERGRYNTRKNEINPNDPIGALLELQLTHFSRALSAFDHAKSQEDRLVIGTATTGASVQGSGNVHVLLGSN